MKNVLCSFSIPTSKMKDLRNRENNCIDRRLKSHWCLSVSKASYEKYADLCSSSFLPLAIDDPKSKASISDLIIALYNGAKSATNETW